MSSSAQKPLHPTPHKTALWLAHVSTGLLLGGALWLMGVRVYAGKARGNAMSSSENVVRVAQPAP